jgi:hypothetical protein
MPYASGEPLEVVAPMLAPFFVLAARSPSRQATLRRLVVAHLLVLSAAAGALAAQGPHASPVFLGQLLLVAGIVEGAVLVGWRLTQLPRSQALEFLLVSPLQPRRVFLGEALVGLALLGLVSLSGLPVLALLAACGMLSPIDLAPLVVMPFTWGAVTGLVLTVWAYEPRRLRRAGEAVVVLLVLVYLIVGVLAGEKLRLWLAVLPVDWQETLLGGFVAMHTHNPFGALRHWLDEPVGRAWERVLYLEVAALAVVGLLLWRACARLLGHFHERHYDPVRDVTHERRKAVGDHPLSWWAVKRVSEYSGRINLWLAGGFCGLYAAYMLAGEHWPAWMGQRIFSWCDAAGGVAVLSAALVVLAAVPASFQYGLWDSSVQQRCRRLELLLLTELAPRDYWNAACAAALVRGRGYFAVALVLWGAAVLSGRLDLGQAVTAVASGVLLWGLYFALGFQAFARGNQANGLGMILTVGLPLGTFALARLGWPLAGSWLPPGMVWQASRAPGPVAWLVGPVAVAALTLVVARVSLTGCDARLRRWYDANHGSKVQS